MLVNVDLDGVVYPFDEAITRLAEHWVSYVKYPTRGWHRKPLTRLPRPLTWNFWEQWDIDQETYDNELWPWAVEHGVFNQSLPPFHGAREGIATLRERGYHVRFVTHKPVQGNGFKHHAIRDCVQWLSWNNIEYDSIVFDGNKSQYTAEAVIDDNPDLKKWVQSEALNILFDQPWNQIYDLGKHDWWDVERSDNWDSVVSKVTARSLDLAGLA